MNRLLRILSKEYGNINQAALLLGFFAFLSQVLALFRDRAIAHFIGPSAELDAYYAAFRVPDLVFVSIASLASITVLIPFISSKMSSGKVTREAEKFLGDVFTVFLSVMVLISAILFFLMPYLIFFIAPGFTPAFQEKAIMLSRLLLLSPILLGLSNLFGAITQLFQRFFVFSLSPIFYNVGIIVGAVILYPLWGIYGLATGVILGAFFHSGIQFIASRLLGFIPRFSLSVNFSNIKKVAFTSLPRTLGLAFNNIAELSMTAFASFLAAGSISIFNFSYNLQSAPLSIFGISYAVAAFPTMVRSISEGKKDDFKAHLKSAARLIVFWSIPVTFLFIVLRAQIVRVILGAGSFSWDDTRLSAACLALFSISVLAQGMIALISRAYYATGNTKRPLVINFISSLLIVVFAYLLLQMFEQVLFFRYFIESLLKVESIPGTEVLMLPLAYSLGTMLNFILQWIFVKRDFLRGEPFIARTFFQSTGAAFFAATAAYSGLNIFSPVFGTTTFLGIFLQGFIAGLLGILIGTLVLYLLRSEEFYTILKALQTRFWRAKVIAPSQEGL